MQARLLFIDEQQLAETNGQFALAGTYSQGHRNVRYICLEDITSEVQRRLNVRASEMVQFGSTVAEDEPGMEYQALQGSWSELYNLLSDLKAC